MIRQCCQCKKIISQDDTGDDPKAVTHTYCEPCYDAAMKEINDYVLCDSCQNSVHEDDVHHFWSIAMGRDFNLCYSCYKIYKEL